MDKLVAIRSVFRDREMLSGGIVEHAVHQALRDLPPALPWNRTIADADESLSYGNSDSMVDAGAAPGPQMETMIWLAARHCKSHKSPMT
jgi:hypothetical protein